MRERRPSAAIVIGARKIVRLPGAADDAQAGHAKRAELSSTSGSCTSTPLERRAGLDRVLHEHRVESRRSSDTPHTPLPYPPGRARRRVRSRPCRESGGPHVRRRPRSPSRRGWRARRDSACRRTACGAESVARSNRRTRTPARASISAASAPAGPAPAISIASRRPAAARRGTRASRGPSTSALFFDPKPRQLHSAAVDVARRAPRCGMKSRSHAGSGSSRLIVGGRKPRDSASAVATTPAAPLAPCGWPIIDLVDEPGTRSASAPNDAPHAARLDRVVQLRRRAVIVDVADLLRRAARACRARVSMQRDDLARRRDPSARGGRRRRSRRSPRSRA